MLFILQFFNYYFGFLPPTFKEAESTISIVIYFIIQFLITFTLRLEGIQHGVHINNIIPLLIIPMTTVLSIYGQLGIFNISVVKGTALLVAQLLAIGLTLFLQTSYMPETMRLKVTYVKSTSKKIADITTALGVKLGTDVGSNITKLI